MAILSSNAHFGQNEELQLTSKDSIVQSSWTVGLGYNFVDDSGDVFDGSFDFSSQWNSLPYPNRLSIARNFKSGLSISAIGTVNKYKAGKLIDKVINDVDKNYLAFDTRLSYDLNKFFAESSWFDPYIGAGLGYTYANNEGRPTYNAILGIRTWFSDRIGLDLSTSGKWRTGNIGTNHIQHHAGVVYQFGIEKGLSKKGKEKLALIEAMQKEQERVNDSINRANQAQEAAALAERLAQEKEKSRLAAIEKAKIDAENNRKQALKAAIDKLGLVYFDFNSSFLNEKSKVILDGLVLILKENPEMRVKVPSHTDSRGESDYNKWLSERRVQSTVAYLLSKGIQNERLIEESFGEEKLLNDCDDSKPCSEDEHKINRRSEFIIIEF